MRDDDDAVITEALEEVVARSNDLAVELGWVVISHARPIAADDRLPVRVVLAAHLFDGDVGARLAVDLGETGDDLGGHAEELGERRGGLDGPALGTDRDVVDVLARQPVRKSFGLAPADGLEAGVGNALDVLDTFGQRVAYEDQFHVVGQGSPFANPNDCLNDRRRVASNRRSASAAQLGRVRGQRALGGQGDAMGFHVRRVVTGHDAEGQAVFVSDGPPPHLIDMPGGTAVADLWAIDGPPADPGDGHDPAAGFPLEPPPGGMTLRIIRLPLPDQSLPREQQFLHNPADSHFSTERPGMHATATLDLEWVVEGEIELELEDGCVRLGAGDCVIQRGTQHRWRVVGDGPCTYVVAMFALDPAAITPSFGLVPRAGDVNTNAGPRRVVTGVDARGDSYVVSDGPAPNCVAIDGGGGMVHGDLWQTGGAVSAADQGGDAEPVTLTLDPYGMGIALKYIELPSDDARAAGLDVTKLRAHMGEIGALLSSTGHHDPDDPGNHKTDTIDFDFILEGTVELELPGHGSKVLGAGDLVVQRGNWHKWHNRGDGPARWVAIMIGAPIGGRA